MTENNPARIVDLSKLVGSDVLMEFKLNEGNWNLGTLDVGEPEHSEYRFKKVSSGWFDKCRISDRWQVITEDDFDKLPRDALDITAYAVSGNLVAVKLKVQKGWRYSWEGEA